MNESVSDTPKISNPNNLPVLLRTIASAVIISRDGKILMGRKDPAKGGVYPNAWHIPGGGVEDGENLEEAVRRETPEEVRGIDFSEATYKYLDHLVGHGETEKTLKTGERVWCEMEFNRFEVRLPVDAADTTPEPGDDLVELRWLSREELAAVEQIPGGREFFADAGYL